MAHRVWWWIGGMSAAAGAGVGIYWTTQQGRPLVRLTNTPACPVVGAAAVAAEWAWAVTSPTGQVTASPTAVGRTSLLTWTPTTVGTWTVTVSASLYGQTVGTARLRVPVVASASGGT